MSVMLSPPLSSSPGEHLGFQAHVRGSVQQLESSFPAFLHVFASRVPAKVLCRSPGPAPESGTAFGDGAFTEGTELRSDRWAAPDPVRPCPQERA